MSATNGAPGESDPVLKGRARHEWESTLLRSCEKPGPNHVLHALLRYAGGKHQCWPSNDTLASDTRLGERQVRRHIGELAKAGLVVVVADRSMKMQRRIEFPSHPNAPRGDIQTPPALNAGRTCEVHAGGTYRPPKTKYETEEERRSWKRGDEETASDAQEGEISKSVLSLVSSMSRVDAVDRSAVRRWACESWLALAPGRECETCDDLVRIAAARDGAALGLGEHETGVRREWVELALESMQAPK